MRSLAAVMSLGVVLSACATAGQIKNDPLDLGAPRTYQASFDATLAAARLAMSQERLQSRSDESVRDGLWMLVGSSGPTFYGGSIVRVVVERNSDVQTSVRVFTRTGDRAAAVHYADAIRERIASNLAGR